MNDEDRSGAPSDHILSTNGLVDLRKLVNRVLDRLKSQHESADIARTIFNTILRESPRALGLLGEEDNGVLCHDDGTPGGTTSFDCVEGTGGFDCSEFNLPAGAKFTCRKDAYNQNPQCAPPFDCLPIYTCTQSPSFVCKNAGESAQVYDCYHFKCANSYTCSQDLDHHCGATYSCETFNCTSGHVFSCMTAFSCLISHTCGAGSVGITDCKTFKYDWNGDPTPNDFHCGGPAPQADEFECKNIFTCNAKDDFVCHKTATFKCGDGDAEDRFVCDPETQYRCSEIFICMPPGLTVNCTPTPYSCNKGGGHGCGNEIVGVECKPTCGFNCKPNPDAGEFFCTPGVGNYTCVPNPLYGGYECTPKKGGYNCIPNEHGYLCRPELPLGGFVCYPNGADQGYKCTPTENDYVCYPSHGYRCYPTDPNTGYYCTPKHGGYDCTPTNGGYDCETKPELGFNCTLPTEGYGCPAGYGGT